MQFKPITAILVLLLVVASLSIAGCSVSSDSSTGSVSTDFPTSGRSKLVEAAVERQRNSLPSTQFTVEWKNDTWVKTTETRQNGSTFDTFYNHYRSVNDASAAFNVLATMCPACHVEASSSTLYHDITGTWPTVSIVIVDTNAVPSAGIIETTVQQYDALIIYTFLSTKTPVVTPTAAPSSSASSPTGVANSITNYLKDEYPELIIVTPFAYKGQVNGISKYTGVIQDGSSKLKVWNRTITYTMSNTREQARAVFEKEKATAISQGYGNPISSDTYWIGVIGSWADSVGSQKVAIHICQPSYLCGEDYWVKVSDQYCVATEYMTRLV